MKRVFLVVAAFLAITAASVAAYRAELVEPDCCNGKKCFHVFGENKHHICNKYCHNEKQKDGECCGMTL